MTAPRIFYFAFDSTVHSGGEIDTYAHVDILNAAGIEAYALHVQPGHHHTWFENTTRFTSLQEYRTLYREAHDYIVVPETLGPRMTRFPGRKVIFNKNLYLGFNALGVDRPKHYAYESPEVVAVFVTSEHNGSHLAYAFPHARMFRMFTHIDCDRFAYRPIRDKERIVCVVDKAQSHLAVLGHVLWARALRADNVLRPYEWLMLNRLPQQRVAELLQRALLFVNLSTEEGLPRTVLEAMACGCVVFSYGTGPLKECLLPSARWEPDDFIGMAARIEEVASGFPANAARLEADSIAGRKVAEAFDRERQRTAVLAAWEAILGSDHQTPPETERVRSV